MRGGGQVYQSQNKYELGSAQTEPPFCRFPVIRGDRDIGEAERARIRKNRAEQAERVEQLDLDIRRSGEPGRLRQPDPR